MVRMAFALVALSMISRAQTLPNGWKVQPLGEQVAVDTLPLRSALSANGKYLLVLNAGLHTPSISVIDVGSKKELGRTPLPDAWFGLTVARGDRVYVGGGASGAIYELTLDPATGTLKRGRDLAVSQGFIGDLAVTANGRFAFAADVLGNSVAVINLETAQKIATWKCGRRPYRLLLTPDAKELLVSSWADGSVYALDSTTGKDLGHTRVGPHATDMLLLNQAAPVDGEGTSAYGARLFVAASNTNSVYAFGLTADDQLKPLDAIGLGLTQMNPLGMTPGALAISKDGSSLYVACADANAVAVTDVSAARARVKGYLAAGAYPTAIQPFGDGWLAVMNGHDDSVSLVPPLNDEQLRAATITVQQASPFRDELLYSANAGGGFASLENHASPIQHVVYVFVGAGSLATAGPNVKALSQMFTGFDHLTSMGSNAVEAYQWGVAGIASDFAVKTSPGWYAGRSHGFSYFDSEPANTAPTGTLSDNARMAGLRSDPTPTWARDALAETKQFVARWQAFGSNAEAPQLSILHLLPQPSATRAASLGDSDRAVGLLIDGLSHSKLWGTTAVFLVTIGSGNGTGLIVSPYTRRAHVESAPVSQLQMLRSMELILGLRPMTQFDAAAAPLFSDFSVTADTASYSASK